MTAPIGARSSGAYYRVRAAVLCFGGWGLQTMLHLWPRLRLIQEERHVLGIDRELPNLDRLTAFAAILPATAGSVSVPAFHVLQPNPDRYPTPRYLERELLRMEGGFDAGVSDAGGFDLNSSHAERAGGRLMQRACDDGFLRSLPVTTARDGAGARAGASPATGGGGCDGAGEHPASRQDTFRAGIEAAGPIVRALMSQVIDPTRLDTMQTRDPLVQTTIFVIAPLAEPRASALVWPVISELVEASRRRHVSRVIAFFSTASFAPDAGRAIEDATAHVALRELEALTGSDGREERLDSLTRLVADCGGPAWEDRVGRKLFDTVHLIDREKSNQSLAESSLDLSILAGNAVEAFLAADGLGHLERSLGPEAAPGRATYSVLGAASIHVPLADYIASAIEEEQKEVIREAVFTEAVSTGSAQKASPDADLKPLGATPESLVRRFVEANNTHLFRMAPDGTPTAWPPGLQIAAEALLPAAVRSKARATKDPRRWQEFTGQRVVEVAAEIHAVYEAAMVAWGAAAVRADGAGADGAGASPAPTGGGGWDGAGASPAPTGGGAAAGNATVPRAVRLATDRIVADMSSAPDGILHASARVSGWLDAVRALLGDLQPGTGISDDGEEEFQTRLAAWDWAFAREAESHRQNVNRWTLILIAACLGALGLATVLLLLQVFDIGRNGRAALLAGIIGVPALLGVAAWLATGGRTGRLRRQRLDLAHEELARHATRSLRRGLRRAYSAFADELTVLQAAVDEAVAALSAWTRSEPEPQRASSDTRDAPTRAAIGNDRLWEAVVAHVRRDGASGARSLERFRAAWQQPPSGSWPGGDRMAQRLSAALEARGSADGDPTSLAGVFRAHAAQATEHLCPTHRLYADHPELVMESVADYGAERLLLHSEQAAPAETTEHRGADLVEDLYVRAKPSAGFEVSHLLSSDVLEVEFGVTADGLTSPLRRVLEQRGMPLLTSKDPLSLSLIRTVNRLGASELILTERCREEFNRLSPGDLARLSLFAADDWRDAAALYGEWDGPVAPVRQLSFGEVRR